jgi:hypothetical protein
LAHLKALESLPELIDLLGIDGSARASLQSELINEIGQDYEVMTDLRSGPSLTPGQKTGHPTAVLRRAGSISVQANGIASPKVSLMPALKAHLMLLWTIEIVLVAEAGAQAEPKLRERDIWRPVRQLQGAEPLCPKRELE